MIHNNISIILTTVAGALAGVAKIQSYFKKCYALLFCSILYLNFHNHSCYVANWTTSLGISTSASWQQGQISEKQQGEESLNKRPISGNLVLVKASKVHLVKNDRATLHESGKV